MCTLFDLSMASRLRHDHLEVAAPTHHSGLVGNGYPWVPPTRLLAVPDKWVRPTKRPADLSVGLSGLTCGPEDENIAWRARQCSSDELRQQR
jgi:hypothetical protein